MSDLNDRQSPYEAKERRAELRVPASTLGEIRTRLVGGSELTLLDYTSRSLHGQSASRLLIGSRISVRVITKTLDAVVAGRVVRANLTQLVEGVPRYDVALTLDRYVDWSAALRRDDGETASSEPGPDPASEPAMLQEP